MRAGVNLPKYGPLGTRDAVTALAERAEALGCTSLWTSDHTLLPDERTRTGPLDGFLEVLDRLGDLIVSVE